MSNNKTLDEVLSNPELREALKKVVAHEEAEIERMDNDPIYEDISRIPYWELLNIPVEWSSIKKLMFAGIVDRPLRRWYILKDREAVKQALAQFEQYQKLALEATVLKKETEIPKDLFDTIVEQKPIKKLFHYSLESEKPVHVLMVSKPGTAKTVLLMEISRLPSTEYLLGSSTSGPGLNDQLFSKFKNGDKVILLLDEVDKMKRDDYASLLSLQETGIVKDVKSGKTREMNINCVVYAACNSIQKIPKENLDRFEIIRIPDYTDEEFVSVVANVLIKHEGTEQELAKYIAKKVPRKSVRQAIRIARMAKSKTKVDEIVSILKRFAP